MSEIITYSNSPTGKYCQIKLDDGKRILISLTQTEIKVFKMKFLGSIPADTIFQITTLDLFSDKYKSAREKMTEKSSALDMLDVFKEILIKCHSIEEAKKTLDSIFKENTSSQLDWATFLNAFKGSKSMVGMDKVVLYFLQPDGIEVKKFTANLIILTHKTVVKYKDSIRNTNDQDMSQFITPSIEIVAPTGAKDGIPGWFLAAYPDVSLWYFHLSDNDRKNIQQMKLEFTINENDLKYLRKVIDVYLIDHTLEGSSQTEEEQILQKDLVSMVSKMQNPNQNNDSKNEKEFISKKEVFDETKEDQLQELSKEHPLLIKLASKGDDCDMIANAKGDFGFFPSNPIPVNGSMGEIKYLARLRCADKAGIMFHRLETIDMKDIDGSVDIFETVCIDGKHWSILCLNMYHPRRSLIAPTDYSFSSYHPIYSKLGTAWGTTKHDKVFPFGLGTFIEQRLGVAFAKKYEEVVKNKGKFKKPEEHKKFVEDLLFAVRRVKKEPGRND